MAQVLAANALAVWGAVSLVWLLSLWRRDASIMDAFWGPGFVLVAGVTLALAGGAATGHALLLALLTALWGGRLGAHLLRRNLAHGEDRRYRAMREAAGDRWPLLSYAKVFLLQGAVMWLVSLPLQFGIALSPAGALGHPATWAGTALFAFGFAFEAVADAQLWRFRRDPASRGRVMDRGLWRWSRHPNYFGEICVWWGLWLAATPAPFAALTVCSPLLVTFLLAKVSGVPMAERHMRDERPGYAAYVARTSSLIPRPPKR
jgi:steroid 5-alpha reductase family enzyme